MFANWDSFYLLVGGAAGALIGLLFIVVTLIHGSDTQLKLRAASVYMTPTVAHLAMVLLLSALATAPGIPIRPTGFIFGGCALVCLAFTTRALFMFLTKTIQASHWSDLWSYGVLPFAACLGLAAAVAAIWLAPASWAARGIAASVIFMLLIAIRNAWDLVTWITAKGGDLEAPRPADDDAP